MNNTTTYVLMIVAGVLLLYMLMNRNNPNCGCRENLSIDQRCRCSECVKMVNKLKEEGLLFGCSKRDNLYEVSDPELCDMSYRKALLHGCNVAGTN